MNLKPSLALLLGALWMPLALAHDCTESPIVLHPGDVGHYFILADVAESEASHYEFSINSDPTVSVAAPDNFDGLGFGRFNIRAIKPGTNTFVFEWNYKPRNASGFCVVEVRVVERPTDPRDVADETTSGEEESTGKSNDPVDTYTGEYILHEKSDFDLGGLIPVRFTRYYASGLNRQQLAQSTLGLNWMHNYDLRVARLGTNISTLYHDGKVIRFQEQPQGQWKLTSSQTVPYSLKEEGGEYLLLDPSTSWLHHFDAKGNLVSIDDTRGHTLTLSYVEGQLSRISDGLGRTLTLTYQGFQHLDTVSDGIRTVRFTHAVENLASVTKLALNESSEVTTFSYDNTKVKGGLMTSKTWPNGNQPTKQEYDTKGRVVRQTRAEGGTYTFAYSSAATIITDPDGNIQKHMHDGAGHLTGIIEEKGQQISSQYDAFGRRIQETRRSGEKTSWSYHPEDGRLQSINVPGGLSLQFEHQPRTFKGFTVYDVSKITYLDRTTELFAYDTLGNLTAFTDRAGRKSFFGYNTLGRMLAATNNAGGMILFDYNSDGTRSTVRRKLSGGAEAVTSYFYDALRRLNKVQHPDGKTRLYVYNKSDLPTSVTDEEGKVSSFEQDANGLLKKIA